MDDVVIEDDVMGLEALDNLDARNTGENSDSELSDDDSWNIDPILRSDTILRTTLSGATHGGQITSISDLGSAAAPLTGKRRDSTRPFRFETNPALRKRQQTRLLGKIRALCGEYCARVGQQAVFIAAVPGRNNSTQTNNLKIIGSRPLDSVIRNNKEALMRDLDARLEEYTVQPEPISVESGSQTDLPPILVEGVPASVHQMTQAMLRNFIPVLLKHATGRGKPGWGIPSLKPVWWPDCLPWANIRSDMRSDEQKQLMNWTDALREVVKACYQYHGQEALLTPFPAEPPKRSSDEALASDAPVVHRIVGSQLMLSGTNQDGVSIRIPVYMCQVGPNSTGGQQIQLVMPTTPLLPENPLLTENNSLLQDGNVHTPLSYDIVSLDLLNCPMASEHLSNA